MWLKRTLTTLSLTAALAVPAVALADDDRGQWQNTGREQRWHDDDRDERYDDDDRYARGVEVHVHTHRCSHGPVPAGQPTREGRYELRTVQRWVPGYYEDVYVPERCKTRENHHRRVTKCHKGGYEKRWVEGRYEDVQQWVWVPAYHREHRHRASPVVTATVRF